MRKFIDAWTVLLIVVQPLIVIPSIFLMMWGSDRDPLAASRSFLLLDSCTPTIYCDEYLVSLAVLFPMFNAPALLVLRLTKRWLTFTIIGYTISAAIILYLALFFDDIFVLNLLLHLVPLSVLLIYVFNGEASKE